MILRAFYITLCYIFVWVLAFPSLIILSIVLSFTSQRSPIKIFKIAFSYFNLKAFTQVKYVKDYVKYKLPL